MFFIFSKILEFVLSPLVWIIGLMLCSLFLKDNLNKPSRKRKLYIWSVILLIVFTNPFLINQVMKWWEIPPYKEADIKTPYDAGIVMGGAMRYYNTQTLRPVYGPGIDRIIQAVSLYHSKKIKKILITGGSGFVLDQQIKEADLLRDVLLKMNIPDSDIVLERQSRNTYENAQMSSALLKTNLYGKRYLVITSAFHMRRTIACFNKQGIITDAYPVDEHSGKITYRLYELIIPNELSINNWDLLIHEWTGMLMYKISGYI